MQLALFVTGSAAFYAAAMILMKHWGIVSPAAMAVLIAGAFALAAWFEIEALRIERLSAIYLLIFGIECVIIAAASFAFLGETVTVREGLGGLLVIAGIALAAT